jgi:hypothetical protein
LSENTRPATRTLSLPANTDSIDGRVTGANRTVDPTTDPPSVATDGVSSSALTENAAESSGHRVPVKCATNTDVPPTTVETGSAVISTSVGST